MTPLAIANTVCIVVGWALAVVASLWLLSSLFRDRARGRPRCPRCWYDLSGADLRCPECGHEPRARRDLFKTRRRYRRAALAAVLLLLGLVITDVPAFLSGWQHAVPSWLLVMIAEPREPASATMRLFIAPAGAKYTAPPLDIAEALVEETWDRLTSDRLAAWQARVYIRRCLAAADVDLSDALNLPERWPIGEPILVRLRPLKFSGFNMFDVDARAPALGAQWALSNPNSDRLHLEPSALARDSLDVEIRVSAAPATWVGAGPTRMRVASPGKLGKRGRTMLSITQHLDVAIRGAPADFLDHVDSSADNKLVLDALKPSLGRGPSGDLLLTWRDTSIAAPWPSIDFGIMFSAELRVGGKIVGSAAGRATWARAVWKDWEEASITWVPGGRQEFEAALAGSGPAPSLRLLGNLAAACAEYLDNPFGKPRAAAWTGTLDMPATIAPTGFSHLSLWRPPALIGR